MKFSQSDINKLKKEYEKIDRVDPSSQAYKNLKSVLKMRHPEQLKQLIKADIKFVSRLAANELARRDKKGWEYEKLFKAAGLKESVDRYLNKIFD